MNDFDDEPAAPRLTRAESPERTDDVMRALPHAVGPEKSVLSILMQHGQEFVGRAVEEKISDEHFYLPGHQILFREILKTHERGEDVDLTTFMQRLIDGGSIDAVGGPAAVVDVFGHAFNPGAFRSHLEILKEKRILRQMLALANTTSAAVYDAPDEPHALLEDLERQIMAIREECVHETIQTTRQSVSRVIEAFEARVNGEPRARGIMTGYEKLDLMIRGLKPGNLFVIGARPSMGKTSLMMNIVEKICIDDQVPTLVFSAEMGREDIIERLIFSRARFVESNAGALPTKAELLRIQRVAPEVAAAPLFVNDQSGPSVNLIRAISRRMKREKNIGLIAIDYLGLLKSVSKQSATSREREISEISAGVKGLAKDLGIPIILLAQLNREVEKRTGKGAGKPRMSDLKDSGSIEADADIIGLLSRSEYYAQGEDKKAVEGQAELEIAKNRNGPTGTVHLTFIASLMRFEPGAPASEQPETSHQAPRSRHD
jgi:replicative DNA helicase